jgi:hypothetical protein
MQWKRFFMVLCLFPSCFYLTISQSEPQKAAELFFKNKLLEKQARTEFRFKPPVQKGNIWIFESTSPEGFVLVDESKNCQIVGYSTNNLFMYEQGIPTPAVVFLESLNSAPDDLSSSGPIKTHYIPVGPMIRTTWSQEEFFNYFCPIDSAGPNNRVYAGCAAVAMGQIIKYYGKFNDFVVPAEFEDHLYGKLTDTVGNYDWGRMENKPITIDTEVSKFLFGLGVLLRMDYGPGSSTTSNFMVYEGFKKLKYYTAMRMIRGTTTPEVWLQSFIRNIYEYQPIYVTGSGHSFICDGVDAAGLFHFNLGWYGYGDGYYPLNKILSIYPNEAIFNLRPYSNNPPPVYLTMQNTNEGKIIQWNKNSFVTSEPLYYRVYINDTTFFNTIDTYINTNNFPPGNHELMVSAIYAQGESTWIGPIQIATKGLPVEIPDPALKLALQEAILRENISPVNDSPTLDQILKISKLEIRNPVQTLAGLENCHNLQMLTIIADEKVELDLGPVSLLKRLKWLEIQNIESENLNLIGRNKRLIYLSLSNTPTDDLSFLSSLDELLELKLSNFQIGTPQVLGNLLSLKSLTINDCTLTNAEFVQQLLNLEFLDLSRNALPRFRISQKLPRLNHLNLGYNQIADVFFLEFIQNIQYLNLERNRIKKLISGLTFNRIQELNLDYNEIDSIWFGTSMPKLYRLSLEGNLIRNVDKLKGFTPALVRLNLAKNDIREFWRGSLQALTYLDLSKNRVTLINDLISNPQLTHVNLSNNQLTDIYPIVQFNNSQNIKFLDLSNNPLSAESIKEMAPILQTKIDTFLVPGIIEPFSPGNPNPPRNKNLSVTSTEITWLPEELPANGYFQVFTGPARDGLSFAGQVLQPFFSVDLQPGQRHFWRIKTVLPDTTFFSGLFSFSTCQPYSLPLTDGFEEYPSFSLFSELATKWIRSYGESGMGTDGRVDPYRKFEGNHSLKLANKSDLKLPMDHLYQSVLNISMQLLIGSDCIAAIKLNDINGANLELFFKSNNICDVFLNNDHKAAIPFGEGEWFPIKLTLHGKSSRITLIIGSYELNLDWVFSGKLARIGELELTAVNGPNWPIDGHSLFHVDNLKIEATGIVGTEEIFTTPDLGLFPNPANGFVYIQMLPEVERPGITLFDLSGKTIETSVSREWNGLWKMDIRNAGTGIYLIRINTGNRTKIGKLFISR